MRNIHHFFTLFISVIFIQAATAQKSITIEDIWSKYTFRAASTNGFNAMNDGLHYTDLEDEGDRINLIKYDIKTGERVGKLITGFNMIPLSSIKIDNYTFSPDGKKILIETNSKPVYRRSSIVENYIYDFETNRNKELSSNGEQMFATFSPVGNKVAFVRKNNLYIADLTSGKEIAVTTDGLENKIKNGWADWVYEEEFSKANYFEWNADGSKLAFVRFDESRVKEYTFDEYNNNLYPDKVTFKYPKAGEDNSLVSVHIYDVATKKTKKVDIGKETDIYIPRIKWTMDKNTLSVQRLNRLQNKLELLFANANTGLTNVIITDEAKTYVDVSDDLTFLPNNKGFIWSSEKDNYNHIYHYDNNGKLVTQITKGNWDVMSFYGYDETINTLYYQSTEQGQIHRDVYNIQLDGSNKKRLSTAEGSTQADFTVGLKYYISNYSNANTPPVYELHSADGTLIKVIENNGTLTTKMKDYNFSKKEFFVFKNTDGIELNGWMMKPKNFDATKKYPVYMHAYNGPGANLCNDGWDYDYWWHSLLNQEGYIVVVVDGRGTLGRGREFKHSTYMQLGKLETLDQIDVAKHLGTLEFVDKTRIGFMGWSYGGYMASLLITKGADYFKACVAVAPVTNWKFYDNIYTERFLRKPQDNKSGYEDNSPINFAKQIKGKFLLVHGSGDDNVHYQNSMEFSRELIKNNIPFDFMTYPNKNHGISGGQTRVHLYSKILKFIKESL